MNEPDGTSAEVKVGGRTWSFELASGSAEERAAQAQVERLLQRHDLTKWIFTTHIKIDGSAIPHSHPVLTLGTRHAGRDDLLLADFAHEQLHWFASERKGSVDAAIVELRQRYPDVPGTLPEGARSEASTYLHLIINYLECAAIRALLPIEEARRVFGSRVGQHYTWIYRTVLEDGDQIAAILGRHTLLIRL